MRRTVMSAVIVILCIVLLGVFGFRVVSPVTASIGQSGVPVICRASTPVGGFTAMQCATPDSSTTWTTVPVSNYVLVTDVFVLPPTSATSWRADVGVWDGYSMSSWLDFMSIKGNSDDSKGEHFTAPALVAKPGWVLRVAGDTATPTFVRALGILTTNYAYLPLMLK